MARDTGPLGWTPRSTSLVSGGTRPCPSSPRGCASDADSRHRDAVVLRGRRRPGPSRRTVPRGPADPARPDRRLGRQGQGLRPPVPADLRPQPPALGAPGREEPAGRVPPADRRLQARQPLLRHRRPPPRLRRAGAGRDRDRGRHLRDRHRHLDRRRRRAPRPRRQELGPALPQAGAAGRRAPGDDQLHRPPRLPPPRRDGRGVGVPPDARGGAPTSTRRRWPSAGSTRSTPPSSR